MNNNGKRTGITVKNEESGGQIDLRDPWVAGILAWLVPGLGHFYQRRYAKAAIFFVCITATLLIGIWMGSYWEKTTPLDAVPYGETPPKLQLARNIYYSWRKHDKRLYFIPHAMIGAVAIPALVQAKYVAGNRPPFFHGIFAPPRLKGDQEMDQPTLNDIVSNLHSWFDIGVLFAVVAGIMNLLAIFDAIGGPAWLPRDTESGKEPEKEPDSP